MKPRWSGELWRMGLILGPSVVAGLAIDRPLEAALAGLAAGVLWHLFQLFRLQRWLGGTSTFGRPDAGGVWGDIYRRVYQLQRNNQDRQRQLATLLDQFQRSAEAMPDAAVALGPNKEIRWFNEAAGRLLKLRPRQDIGQPIQNLLRNPVFQAYLSDGDHNGSIEMRSPGDGQLRLATRIIPYGDDQYLLLAQDVTERHRLERVRKDFVANVSHELRTPLTVISGFVENLQHDGSGCAERWRRPLHLMSQQTTRMQRIVEDLLLLASLEGERGIASREPVDVPEMLAEIVEEVQAAAGAEQSRDIVIESDPVRLSGNSLQLRSAFANLVTNATKYTPPGGRIRVRWFADDRGGVIEVRDTGEGIAPEHIPRLTERFYRVDTGRSREKGGTGLGLAIVKHVLQKHGARLEIESELGRGSCFRCIFPLDRLVRDANGAASLADAG
jgi:two-component system phosphate regulon sensor histidine kinase PhoR